MMKFTWLNRTLAKRKVKNQIKKKGEIMENLEKQEEKVFELFRLVLRNCAHSAVSKEGDIEIGNGTTSIMLIDSESHEISYLVVEKPDNTFMEFPISNKKTKILRDEFDNVMKNKSIRYKIKRRKGIDRQLDDLLEFEKCKI